MYSKWCCNPVVSLPLFVSLFHFWLLPLRLLSLQRAVAMSSYCNEAAAAAAAAASTRNVRGQQQQRWRCWRCYSLG